MDPHSLWLTPIINEQTFTFDVAACKNALIYLTTTVGEITKDAYEITLGADDNRKVLLKKAKDGEFEQVREVNLFSSLECGIAHPFWVTWADGWIKMGRGETYMYEFLVWEDPDEDYPRIYALSLTNGDEDGDDDGNAVWRFKRDQGQ